MGKSRKQKAQIAPSMAENRSNNPASSLVADSGGPQLPAGGEATNGESTGDDNSLHINNGQIAHAEPPLKVTVYKRLVAEGRWPEIEPLRNAMMKEAKAKGMAKEDAQQWTYGELDRLYPPVQPVVIVESEGGDNSELGVGGDGQVRTHARTIPPGWPELPPNASLSAEIAWVQANRLDVVDGDRIRLDRAKEPAPSRAALGWLETSIRSYAKYVEVAAKATSTAQDEQAQVRQERMALDEVRGLLGEMVCNG